MGIALTYESSRSKIHFLDLVIERKDQRFIFSTYFKPTDRNGYIPTDSCHHKSWLRSVPKSQFLRLCRNCTDIDTFKAQATVLRERFIEKRYNHIEVDQDLTNVLGTDRSLLLEDKPQRENDDFKWSFLTSFFTQYKQLKYIFERHWDILRNDKILGPLLPERPKMIYRGVPSLKNKLAPNIINPPIKPTFFHNWTGFNPCKRCTVRQYNICGRRTNHEFGQR